MVSVRGVSGARAGGVTTLGVALVIAACTYAPAEAPDPTPMWFWAQQRVEQLDGWVRILLTREVDAARALAVGAALRRGLDRGCTVQVVMP